MSITSLDKAASAYAQLSRELDGIPSKVPAKLEDLKRVLATEVPASHRAQAKEIIAAIEAKGYQAFRRVTTATLTEYAKQNASAVAESRAKKGAGKTTARSGAMGVHPSTVHAKLAKTKVEIYDVLGGERLDDAAAAVARRATDTGHPVSGKFNGIELRADPGDNASTVLAAYRKLRDEAHAVAMAKYNAPEAVAQRAAEATAAAKAAHELEKNLAAKAGTPHRDSEKLVADMQKEAKAAGYGAYDMYAVQTLTHPDEIREFARYYQTTFPETGIKNMEFAISNGDWIANGTTKLWKKAVAELKKEAKAATVTKPAAQTAPATVDLSTAPWPKSLDELRSYLDKLTGGAQTYDSAAKAMARGAEAAFNWVANELGNSGAQAGWASLSFVRQIRGSKGPIGVIKGENALYPQYNLRQTFNEFMTEFPKSLAPLAQYKLEHDSTWMANVEMDKLRDLARGVDQKAMEQLTASFEHDAQVKTRLSPKTADELTATLKEIVKGPHDYNTSATALSDAAVAAFNYVAKELGASGAQAGWATMEFLRSTRNIKGPFMLVDGSVLVDKPLDGARFLWEDFGEFMRRLPEQLAPLARERLADISSAQSVHPDVLARWQEIAKADGKAPSSAPIRWEVSAGSNLDSAVNEMLSQANKTDSTYAMSFNGIELVAHPGDSAAKVKQPFEEEMQQATVRAQARAAKEAEARAARLTALKAPLSEAVPAKLELDARGLVRKGDGFFDNKSFAINLITPAQLAALPEGTVLFGFHGKQAIVGVDYIDDDTRGGFTAYGFKVD